MRLTDEPIDSTQAIEFNNFMRELRTDFSDILGELGSNPVIYDFYREALKLDAPFTAAKMMAVTQIPEASVYRALKKLMDLGLMARVGRRIRGKRGGGPRPSIWKVV